MKIFRSARLFSSHQTLMAFFLLILVLMNSSKAISEEKHNRIVSIGGSITEIIYALGEESRLIARDTTSVFPKETFSLPDVGYIRQLSPEGVLSVNPDLILALEGSGPPETIQTLKATKTSIVFIPEGYTAEKIIEKIIAVGKAIGKPEKAAELAQKTKEQLAAIKTRIDGQNERKKVLFILSLRGGKVLTSGKNTSADGIIKLAGAQNIISEFHGFKQVSDEAIITAAPDAILMMKRRGNHSQNDEEVFAHPAIAATPAGKNKNIIRMDGLYLLGFGPRTAQAILDLNESLK